MILDRDLVAIKATDTPGVVLRTCTREQGEQWVPGGRQGSFYLAPIASCACCGNPAKANRRCERHQDRNPCVIIGCTRTGKAPANGTLSENSIICGQHWRRYVPPRSRLRKAYHRHFARAKRFGWSPESIAAFYRFWDGLVRQVRRREESGYLDQGEIERMFGWDADN